MNKNQKSGPAFPSITGYMGMTLRDYFAAKAMQAIISRPDNQDIPIDDVAADAYDLADAMLKVREEGE